MWRIQRQLQSIIGASLVLSCLLSLQNLPQVIADTTSAPSLVVSQLKITSNNGQFITLYNATNQTIDMSTYQLEYFNNFDLSKATSSRLISLTGTLPAHSYYMVSDDSLLLCYQLTIDSVSLGLSSTAGMIEVLAFVQSGPGGSAVPTLQDSVSWSKTAVSGVQTLPSNTNAFLQRQPLDTAHNPIVNSAGLGTWQTVQPDPANACKLQTVSINPQPVQTGLTQLLPPTEPPATIITLSGADSVAAAVPQLPAADIGLKAPQVTELLPNPEGSGNDGSDEFIELYNPNSSNFDLSGFALQVGLKSLHSYVFPANTLLPPNGFVAYSSADTGLSLSNSGGHAALLDPFGQAISSTEQYAVAKDGQSWALANGKWYWTTSPTPNKANIIKQPISKKAAAAIGRASKKAAVTKSAKTTKIATVPPAAANQAPVATTPIHRSILALVAGLALLYGAYEYRTDLANRIRQLRHHRRDRSEDRLKADGGRSD